MIRNIIYFLSLLSLLIFPPILNAQIASDLMDDDGVSDKLTKNIKIEQKAGNLYNVEFRNADIKDIIRYFAHEYGLNIIADKDVEGTVTASLGNVTIKQALGQILDSQNYTMIEIDNVIRVKAKLSPVTTFKLHNVSAADISDNMVSLLGSEGKMVIDEVTNSIMVTDSDDNINIMRNFIEGVDVKGRQVLIETKFVETTLNTSKNLGVEWGTTITVQGAARPHTFPFGSTGDKYAFGNENAQIGTDEEERSNIAGFPVAGSGEYTFGTLDFAQFKAVLKALLTDDDTKIISNPQVATLNNRLATIGVTTEYPLPTYEVDSSTGELTVSGYEYKNIGITLNVTPFIASDDYITMTIEPTVGTVGETISVGDTGFKLPIISSKTATTKVTIKNGETIVIGGLISTEKIKSTTKVPLLGSIPLLGKLFSYEGTSDYSSELLIFVTPHILNLEGDEELKREKIDELYEDIDRLMFDEDYGAVISKVDEILELDKGEERAKDLKVKAEENIKQKEKEEEGKAEEREAFLRSLWREANSLYAGGEYQQAKDKYIYILAESPDDKMAVKMLKRSQEKVEAIKENDLYSLIREGKSYYRENDFNKALASFREALVIDPTNRAISNYIVDIELKLTQEELGKVEKPLEEIEREKRVQSLWEEANSFYAAMNYEGARNIYTRILALESDNKSAMDMLKRSEEKIGQQLSERASALLLSAEKSFRKREYSQALESYYSVLQIDPDNEDAELGITELNKYIQEREEDKQVALDLNRALKLYQGGSYSEAKFVLDKILSKRPDNEEASKYRRLSIQKINKDKDIAQLWEEANRYYTARDYERALDIYTQILALEPDSRSAMDMLDRCEDKLKVEKDEVLSSLLVKARKSSRKKDYTGALSYFEKVLEIDPGNREADSEIVEIQGLIEQETFKKSLDKALLSAKSLYKQGSFKEAKIILNGIIEKSPENREALGYLELCSLKIAKEKKTALLWQEADTLFSKGDYGLARQKYAQILSIDSGGKVALVKINKCEEKLEKAEERKIAALLTSGRIEYKRKEYLKALERFEKVLKLDPANQDAVTEMIKVENALKEQSWPQEEKLDSADLRSKIAESERASQLWEEANKLYAERAYLKALKKYASIVTIEPENQSALEMLNRCEDKIEIKRSREVSSLLVMGEKARRSGNYDKALEYFERVLELEPANKEADGKILEIALQKDGKRGAKKKSLELAKRESKEEELKILWEEANMYYSQKDFKSAWDKYADILSLDPEDKIANDMLNRCEDRLYETKVKEISSLLLSASREFRNKNYDRALKYYQDVLQIDPDSKEARRSIEDIYKSMRSLEMAERVKGDLVKAKSLYSKGRFKEAEIMLDELLKLDSKNREIQKYLTLTIEAIRQKQDLKNFWEEANSLYAEGEYELAWRKYSDILVIDSNDEVARQMVKKCRSKIQQYNIKEISALLSAGEKYLVKGENQKALNYFMRVLELDPANKGAEENISKIKDSLRAEEIEPYKGKREKEIGALYLSGVKNYDKADYDKAIYLFEKVLIADPTHENAYRYLEMAHKRKSMAESEVAVEVDFKTAVEDVISIEDILEEKSLTEKEIRELYRGAVRLYKKKEYQKALDKFRSLSQLDSKYQKASKKKIKACLEKIRKPLPLDKVEEKYQLGLDYFKKDLYKKSIQLFLEVLDLKPKYKDARKYLKLSRDRLQMMDSLGDFEQAAIEDK
ncbi:MAG: tetratricopeptide repeat protein [Candidatus Kaelpia imicola]|nr:tetratricopeptide repeat protein [Candidatus Kaelpia imicola]